MFLFLLLLLMCELARIEHLCIEGKVLTQLGEITPSGAYRQIDTSKGTMTYNCAVTACAKKDLKSQHCACSFCTSCSHFKAALEASF